MGLCYATSEDGIVWDKPELGLVEFEGRTENNLVIRTVHGSGVLKEEREPDPAKRYKILTSCGRKGLGVSFSPDGVRWTPPTLCPTINPYRVDGTHYNVLWVEELGEYVGFTRMRDPCDDGSREVMKRHGAWPPRQVGRTTSKDFVNWTQATAVMQGVDENRQIYSMPVFRHGNVYLGLPVIHNQRTDRAWTELAWSPDTINWRFVCPGSPLIPNSDEVGTYDWGCAYSSAYPIILEGRNSSLLRREQLAAFRLARRVPLLGAAAPGRVRGIRANLRQDTRGCHNEADGDHGKRTCT